MGIVIYIIIPVHFLSSVSGSIKALYRTWAQDVITNPFIVPVEGRRPQNRYTDGGRVNCDRFWSLSKKAVLSGAENRKEEVRPKIQAEKVNAGNSIAVILGDLFNASTIEKSLFLYACENCRWGSVWRDSSSFFLVERFLPAVNHEALNILLCPKFCSFAMSLVLNSLKEFHPLANEVLHSSKSTFCFMIHDSIYT